jgi:hypothetical protein
VTRVILQNRPVKLLRFTQASRLVMPQSKCEHLGNTIGHFQELTQGPSFVVTRLIVYESPAIPAAACR